jgi:GH25 family lysozyme M1 (1,4-beta-N-acetylmuramidase)/acylphosphatase
MRRTSPLALLLATLALTSAACAPADGTPGSGEDVDANDDALKECAAKGTVEGVDVSYYQGDIDWNKARAAGIVFGIARTSDGTGFKDPKFAKNWAGMKAAGVVRGTYQFFRPTQDPIAQADLMLKMLNDVGGLEKGDLPPTLDIEVTDGVSGSTILSRAKAWLDHVEAATGRKPLVYTAPGWWSQFGAPSGFDSRSDLWVANWGVSCPSLPGSWSHWQFWQWSATGSVPGIPGQVDRDRFNGSLADLLAFAGASSGGGGGGGNAVGAQPLGGSTKGAPALAPNADGRLEVFSVGGGGQMVTTFQLKPNAGWSGWYTLGGSLSGTLAAGVNQDGRIEIFGRGGDGAVWHAWQDAPNGKIGGFVSLGGQTKGDPVVASNADGRLEVFVIGTDGGVWHSWQQKPNGIWTDWSPLGAPAATPLADARVIKRHDGRVAVVARGTQDGAVYFAEQMAPNGGWTSWSSLGGAIDGAPAIANNQDSRLEVFGRGTDGALWHAWERAPDAGFGGWNSLGGVVFDPVAGNDTDGRIEIFVRGSDAAMYRIRQAVPNGGWEDWAGIGGSITGAPAVANNQDGRLEVFGRSTDGSVTHSWQRSPGVW